MFSRHFPQKYIAGYELAKSLGVPNRPKTVTGYFSKIINRSHDACSKIAIQIT